MLKPPNLELEMNRAEIVDVVIVGGGPAGQSAALLLGRCSRKVTLVDASAVEMESDTAAGNIPGHDGSIPYESRRAGRGLLRKFETVSSLRTTVDDVERSRFGFTVHCGDGTAITTRALLLASDLVAPTPAITGAEAFYGSSLHECPYCDGWEHRGRRIGVLGADEAAVDLALKLLQWSPRITLFSNGGMVGASCMKRLEKGRIQVVPGTVSALEGQDRNLELLQIDGASAHPCEALFFSSPRKYHSELAARLGCDLERMSGAVYWRPDGDMVIEGLFVVGSASDTGEIKAIAASEGLKAAKAANEWLLEADHSYLAVTPDSAGTRAIRQTGASRRMAI
jgi:thioredoxin reductase